MLLLIVILAGVFAWLGWRLLRSRSVDTVVSPAQYEPLLNEHVAYYRALTADQKKSFADRVSHFLGQVRVEGVDTTVDDVDRVLVASSAIIPIFGFEGWDYYRLTNVLLYADRFNADYETTGTDRNILGMVGEGGALQSTMVLSKPALHQGFADESSKANTGIHEFVHLLDKADGATDGLPEYMLDKQHIKPWLQLMHRSIGEIKANHSDIDPYATTNEAEFFCRSIRIFFQTAGPASAETPGVIYKPGEYLPAASGSGRNATPAAGRTMTAR